MTPFKSSVIINIGGYKIGGWQDVSIRLGIDLLPWAASVSASFPDLGGFLQDIPEISPGDEAVVIVNGKPLITGRLITILEEVEVEQHIFSLEIASKTLDLTDCSVEIPSNQLNSTNVDKIASQICKNFGISVKKGASLPNLDIEIFSAVLTETPFQILDRLCRLAGILFLDTPEGNILLSNVGQERMKTGLKLGENIEKISWQRSISGRYREIRAIYNNRSILLWDPAPDGDYKKQIEALTQCAVAQDEAVPATRKLLVPIELADPHYKVTEARVAWEVARRMGRSRPIKVTVDSWTDAALNVWMPNKLVFLDDGETAEELLITEVELSKSMGGTRANLTLMKKEAFMPQPIVNPAYNQKLANMIRKGKKSS